MANHWTDLRLHHLAVLEAVARRGSFWDAADDLDVSQSAISQQIAALEGIAGQRLVERSRGRRGISLTDAGSVLLRHADAVMTRVRAAEADLRALASGEVGVLRVGVYQSVANRVLPRLIREFSSAWPDVTIQITQSGSDDDLLADVAAGTLDLAFNVLPLPEGPFLAVELMRDPYFVLIPASSPLAGKVGPVRLRDLAGIDLVGAGSCRGTTMVESHLRRRGLDSRVVFRSDDNGTVQSMVGAGLGIALAPRLAVDENDPNIRLREISDEIPPRVIVLAYERDRRRTRAADAFIEVARKVCADLERS